MIRGLARSARRRLKRQSRARDVGLILVSLIDIFTNLVIYLMFSSTGVEALPNPKTVSLPDSLATKKPKEAYVVTVTHDDIVFGDHRVMTLADVENSTGLVLEPLDAELEQLALQKNEDGVDSRGEVNILADRNTPYSVLKRVMQTCGKARFERISLAVNERGGHS